MTNPSKPAKLAVEVLLIGIIERFPAQALSEFGVNDRMLFVDLLIRRVVAYLTSMPELPQDVTSALDNQLIKWIDAISTRQQFFRLVREIPLTKSSFTDTFYLRHTNTWRVTTSLGYIMHEAFYANLPAWVVEDSDPFSSIVEGELLSRKSAGSGPTCRYFEFVEPSASATTHTSLGWWMKTVRPQADRKVLSVDAQSFKADAPLSHNPFDLGHRDPTNNSTQEIVLDVSALSHYLAAGNGHTVAWITQLLKHVEDSFPGIVRATLVLPTWSTREDVSMLRSSTPPHTLMGDQRFATSTESKSEWRLVKVPGAWSARSYFIEARGSVGDIIGFAYNFVAVAVFVVDDEKFSLKDIPDVSETLVSPSVYDINVERPREQLNDARGTRRIRVFILTRSMYMKSKDHLIKTSDALHMYWKTLPEFQKSMPVGVFSTSVETETVFGIYKFLVTDLVQQNALTSQDDVTRYLGPNALPNQLGTMKDTFTELRVHERGAVWGEPSTSTAVKPALLPPHPVTLIEAPPPIVEDRLAQAMVVTFDGELNLMRNYFYPLIVQYPVAIIDKSIPLLKAFRALSGKHLQHISLVSIPVKYGDLMQGRTSMRRRLLEKNLKLTGRVLADLIFMVFPRCMAACARRWDREQSWFEFRRDFSDNWAVWTGEEANAIIEEAKLPEMTDLNMFKHFMAEYVKLCFVMCLSDPPCMADSERAEDRSCEYDVEVMRGMPNDPEQEMLDEPEQKAYDCYPALFRRSYDISDAVEVIVMGKRMVLRKEKNANGTAVPDVNGLI